MRRNSRRDEDLLPIVAGTIVGIAGTAATLWLARRRDRMNYPDLERSPIEKSVRQALRGDDRLATRGVLVTELGPGVVELAGMVDSADEVTTAVAAAQKCDGVATVVNRLAVRDEEARLAETRQRFADGDPSLTETHWTGLHIGMGRRRQSLETDPDQRDDRARILDRELGANRVAREDLGPDVDGGDWSIPRSRPEDFGSTVLRDGYGKPLE